MTERTASYERRRTRGCEPATACISAARCPVVHRPATGAAGSRGSRSHHPAHAAVLAHLEHDTPLSIAELARRAGVARQTMHRAVTQLLGEGLLISTPGPGFPRSTLIALTDAGRQRRDIASGVLRDLEGVLREQLGDAALAQLRDNLTRAWPR